MPIHSKPDLRLWAMARRRALSKDHILQASERIAANLTTVEEFQRARHILTCLSFDNEVDTWRIADELTADPDRTVYVPRVSTDGVMHVHPYPCNLSTLRMGLRQPEKGAPELPHKQIDVILDVTLVLGLAFDRQRGYRLGHGKGYFDRFLRGRPFCAIGLSMQCFILDGFEVGLGDFRRPPEMDDMVNESNEDAGKRFLDLDHVHGELDDIFLGHQEALFFHDLSMAAELLEDFESGLRIHMRHEEELLLPIYEARRDHKTALKGVGAEVYILEHKRMLELLANIRANLRDLASRCRCKVAPRDIIALLDQECTFKHLVQHHNMREHNVLYPSLDKLASEDERAKLMKQCSDEWTSSRNDCS